MTTTLIPGVCGHHLQRQQLSRMLVTGRLPHALLFAGPRSSGKRHLAIQLVYSLLQRSKEARAAATRSLLLAGNHPDFHFLAPEEGKKEITVEGVRALSAIFHLRPYLSSARAALINDAHLLNSAAANALLMTLEEPPADSVLILVSHAPHRLPETIVSRCQMVHFGSLSEDQIREVLSGLVPELAEKKLKRCLALCSGSLEALALEPFINPKTSAPVDPAGLQEHLEQLSSEIEHLEERLAPLFEKGRGVASPLILASEFGAKDELTDIVWQVLRAAVRNKMLSGDPVAAGLYAQVMLEVLTAQQRIRERNLNPQIQLSELFLKISEAGA